MSSSTKLQVPVTAALKEQLAKRAHELGFVSVNEVVRVILQNFAQGNITIQFVQGNIQQANQVPMLNAEQEKALAQSMADIHGKEFVSVDSTHKNAFKGLFSDKS